MIKVYEENSSVGTTDKKQEAIALVKQKWGEDDTVTFRCDSVSNNGEYIIAVVSKETAPTGYGSEQTITSYYLKKYSQLDVLNDDQGVIGDMRQGGFYNLAVALGVSDMQHADRFGFLDSLAKKLHFIAFFYPCMGR